MIVRKEAKEYGTANRLEGVYEQGERVCLVEDVVTSGGALLEAVEAVREAGLVVGRRSASSTARRAAPTSSPGTRCGCRSLFRAGDCVPARKNAAKPHG